MGTVDPGMLVISGRVNAGISLEHAEEEVNLILQQVMQEGITEEELQKVKNQALSTLAFGEVEVMNRAMNLAFAKLSGDANLVNEEKEIVEEITKQHIDRVAKEILVESNSSVLYYRSETTQQPIDSDNK